MRSLSFVIVASVGLVACGAEEAPPKNRTHFLRCFFVACF